MKTLELHFGALAPALEEQLLEQGLKDKDVEKHEKIRQSILMLWFHGYITDAQHEKIIKKLFNDIKKRVKPISLEV